MVESSIGGVIGCRCGCQDEYNTPQDDTRTSSPCCSPNLFTSILLGVLSCVLMTGGVFLAFHRWDPLWLVVSGVGVVLVFIASISHCCYAREARLASRRQSGGAKVLCGRQVQQDHLHGLVANGGSLSEQLLPLGNGRSVSQLSLNMLPGYFPPVVTTYGIEQHSSVVQNINRIIQQQQQNRPQTSSPGSNNPTSVDGAGNSFFLLSLPNDTSPASVQNLVATVYQLDGSVSTDNLPVDPTLANPPTTRASASTATPLLLLKNAEVQTCNAWPNISASTSTSIACDETSPSANGSCVISATGQNPPIAPLITNQANALDTTQIEGQNLLSSPVNLMDCSSAIPTVCDNNTDNCCTQTTHNSASESNPSSPPSVLVDVSLPQTEILSVQATSDNSVASVLSEVPETQVLVEVGNASANNPADIPASSAHILIDIDATVADSNNSQHTSSSSTPVSTSSAPSNTSRNSVQPVDTGVQSGAMENFNPQIDTVDPELTTNLEHSDIEEEMDDNELMARSSPPPSYDDVAQEGGSVAGAFGIAYGTL